MLAFIIRGCSTVYWAVLIVSGTWFKVKEYDIKAQNFGYIS